MAYFYKAAVESKCILNYNFLDIAFIVYHTDLRYFTLLVAYKIIQPEHAQYFRMNSKKKTLIQRRIWASWLFVIHLILYVNIGTIQWSIAPILQLK